MNEFRRVVRVLGKPQLVPWILIYVHLVIITLLFNSCRNDSTDKKHFSLAKTVSLLDLSDDGGSPHDEFWKLNAPMEVHESGDLLLSHLNAVRDKMRRLPDDLMTVLKCGSATTNTATEPVRQISFSHNITSAEDFCDTFDGGMQHPFVDVGIVLCFASYTWFLGFIFF